uniref:Ig-like domain-containing protein n=1 Tax=Accipiter nisus TaxID=211598 RepID=A0A8B9MRC3_9AVES
MSFFLGFSTNLLLSKTPHRILAQTNNKTEILCELKTEHAGLYWYRWSQEKQNFEFLVFSSPFGKAVYGANISEAKFSVPGAGSRSSYSLHISNLHASDNGTYYCSISQSSQLLLGSGTQLSVGNSRFFLTFPPSGKSSIKARGHHPLHRWGGSDSRFQACPSHKGLNWGLFLKAHNQPSLGSSRQKSERSVGVTGGMMLYRPRVHLQQHFPLDHQAGGGIEKPMRLK